MFFSNSLFPLACMLTHRRGVAVGIFLEDPLKYKNILTDLPSQLTDNSSFEFLKNENVFLLRVIGKTAENLLNCPQLALKNSGLTISELNSFFVGVGPGSFTGLRLGCTFVNGIKLGNNDLKLFPVKTFLTTDLLQFYKDTDYNDEILRQLGEYVAQDESTGYVTFYDIFASLVTISKNQFNHVPFLIPEYGREPGPVIKLQEREKNK